MPDLSFRAGDKVSWDGREGVVCGVDERKVGPDDISYAVRFYDDWNNLNYRYERDLESVLTDVSNGLHEVIMPNGPSWSYMVEDGKIAWFSFSEGTRQRVLFMSKNNLRIY